MAAHTEQRVRSAGVTLCVREHSPAGAGREHVVLVHGYPDRQDMWEPVVTRLDPDRLHVVTYDVRGAGRSEPPATTSGYRCELLVEDLAAVVGASVPDDERFHLVGHDWGSVQLWDAVAEPQHGSLAGRIASFTSISGPSLDHLAHLYRNPAGRRGRLLKQSVRSWYVYAFHLPWLPEAVWSRRSRWLARLMAALDHRAGHGHWTSQLGADAANGLGLYRANVRRRMRRPGRLHTDVPVLVVVPTRDKFLTDVTLEDLDRFCRDVRVVEVDAGHWVTRSHPQTVAELVTEHVRIHSARSPGNTGP